MIAGLGGFMLSKTVRGGRHNPAVGHCASNEWSDTHWCFARIWVYEFIWWSRNSRCIVDIECSGRCSVELETYIHGCYVGLVLVCGDDMCVIIPDLRMHIELVDRMALPWGLCPASSQPRCSGSRLCSTRESVFPILSCVRSSTLEPAKQIV